MTDFKDTAKYKQGHTAEMSVSTILQQRGWYIVPSYDYSGREDNKAPRMQGQRVSYVLPDLDCARKGSPRCWLEVKSKTQPTLYRKTNTLEHGIPKRHYQDYLEIQAITGTPVFIIVREEDTGHYLWAKLDALTARVYEGGKMSRGGMVFFPVSNSKNGILGGQKLDELTTMVVRR